MHPNPNSRGSSPPTSLRTLEILRLKDGSAQTVILTDLIYRGLMTHYVRRTEVCLGHGCRECNRGSRLFYRGYGAALKFEGESRKWLPVVLELTERLEHDLNGLWARGQVWEISKAKDTKETHGRVTGVLKNQLDPAMLPPPVDIEVPLRTLFRVEHLPWGAINNVPKATAVSMVELDARAIPSAEQEQEPAPSYGSTRFSQQQIDELARRTRMPVDSANGKAH